MTRIPAAERRAALVQAALRVVARKGVASATTRAIVAEAGMSLASFHYAFESRDELMAELVTFVLGEQDDALQLMLMELPDMGSSDDPIREAVRSGLRSYFEVVRRDPEREKAMFELTQYAMRNSELEAVARRQYESYYDLAERAIAQATQAIGVEWDRPVREVATLLVALTDGLTLGWLVNRDDAMAETVIEFAAESIASLLAVRHDTEVHA
jgi:AcrR family transcriptional regulator